MGRLLEQLHIEVEPALLPSGCVSATAGWEEQFCGKLPFCLNHRLVRASLASKVSLLAFPNGSMQAGLNTVRMMLPKRTA